MRGDVGAAFLFLGDKRKRGDYLSIHSQAACRYCDFAGREKSELPDFGLIAG